MASSIRAEFEAVSELMELGPIQQETRSAADDEVLAAGIAGDAEFIATGDKLPSTELEEHLTEYWTTRAQSRRGSSSDVIDVGYVVAILRWLVIGKLEEDGPLGDVTENGLERTR